MIELIREEPRPLVIVLSALKGITDQLIDLIDKACRGEPADTSQARQRHVDVLGSVDGEARQVAETRLFEHFEQLDRLLVGVGALGEVPDRTRDRILSFGERMSIILAAAHLAHSGIPARTLVADEAGILTTDEAGDARILARSCDAVLDAFSTKSDLVYVVAGFVGRDPQGRITTLGRGGSDTTATFLASVLGGPAVLWKDTAGLLTGDPNVVSAPQVIGSMHYLDALELAHYGLPAIAAKALHPARRAGIQIEIRPFLSDEPPSIIGGVDVSSQLAISCVPEIVMVDLVPYEATVVSSLQSAGGELAEPRPGRVLLSLARVLEALSVAGVVPLLLTEASPAGETTIGIKAADRPAVERVLATHAGGLEVTLRDDLAAVSLIGSSMRGRIGFAASVFACLAAFDINIESIAQTASERNISVIVKSSQAKAAVRALHARFVEQGGHRGGATS